MTLPTNGSTHRGDAYNYGFTCTRWPLVVVRYRTVKLGQGWAVATGGSLAMRPDGGKGAVTGDG